MEPLPRAIERALQPIGPPITSVIYTMRGMSSTQTGGGENGEAPVYDLVLLAELLWASRSEAAFGRWSTADQKARFPAIVDNIFSDVPLIAAGQTIKLF